MTAQQCLPPEGVEDGSYHWLVSDRETCVAEWISGWWFSGIARRHSPKLVAGWGYRYDRPVPPRDSQS